MNEVRKKASIDSPIDIQWCIFFFQDTIHHCAFPVTLQTRPQITHLEWRDAELVSSEKGKLVLE